MIPQKHCYPWQFQPVQETTILKANLHTNYHAKIEFDYQNPQQIECIIKKLSPFILMLLQNPQPWVPWTSFENHPRHSSPYFAVTTYLQNLFSSSPNLHSHFPNKNWLKVVSFRIPNPHKAKECMPYPIPPSGTWTPLLNHPTKNSSIISLCYSPHLWEWLMLILHFSPMAFGNFSKQKLIKLTKRR